MVLEASGKFKTIPGKFKTLVAVSFQYYLKGSGTFKNVCIQTGSNS